MRQMAGAGEVDQYQRSDSLFDARNPFHVPQQALGSQALKDTLEDIEIGRPDWDVGFEVELGNPDLPMWQHKQEIIDAVNTGQVTLISAPVGAGKTTQLPQFLYESGYRHIYMTQPRRIAAKEIYARVNSELVESLGEAVGVELVSYHTGAGLIGSVDAPIKIETDGLRLVKELKDNDEEVERVLVVDEIHEWNDNLEGLVAFLKRKIAKDPNLKVVIMSGTMNGDELADFFADVCNDRPTVIEVEGRQHEIDYEEKPESDVLEQTVEAIIKLHKDLDAGIELKQNGILNFMPGKQEIEDQIDAIWERLPKDIAAKTHIVGLHAKMTPEEQDKALRAYPGVKVVVSTDVAQTSLTIPDIGWVIDSGLHRVIELDENGTQGLMLRPASQADCKQRAGRTGRVAPGRYTLTRLNDASPFIALEARALYPLPAILTTELDRSALRYADVGLDISEMEFFHQPTKQAIARAKYKLHVLGALDEDGKITNIGQHMNEYPLLTSSTRIMVEAAQHSENIRAYMAMALAAHETGGLKKFGPDSGRAWEALSEESETDMLAQLDIFMAAQNMTEQDMRDYDLEINNVHAAEETYRKVARRAKVTDLDNLPVPSPQERETLRECIRAGYVHSIFVPTDDGRFMKLDGTEAEPREISNRSVTLGSVGPVMGDPRRIELIRKGQPEIRQIIEGVTRVSQADIGRLAVHLSRWIADGFTLRGGTYMQKEVLHVGQYAVDKREVPAQPSPQLRATAMEHVRAQPGQQLQSLHVIKRELEKLAHKTKLPLPRLTQDDIDAYVTQATPDSIISPSLIDENLRLIIARDGISKAKYISPDQEERILDAAPPTISFDTATLRLSYHQGKAVTKISARHIPVGTILALPEDPRLPDDRQIHFRYGKNVLTLSQLKKTLQNEGLL